MRFWIICGSVAVQRGPSHLALRSRIMHFQSRPGELRLFSSVLYRSREFCDRMGVFAYLV